MTIEEAKQVLKENGYLSPMWHIDDIKGVAENKGVDLTKEQLLKVVDSIEHNHDANIGINWDNIDYHINEIINP